MAALRKAFGSIVFACTYFAFACPVSPASALPVPDPDLIVFPSQLTKFLQEEMKHTLNLRERQLIHDELVLIHLDQLREPD
jgi:hypothetical protein